MECGSVYRGPSTGAGAIKWQLPHTARSISIGIKLPSPSGFGRAGKSRVLAPSSLQAVAGQGSGQECVIRGSGQAEESHTQEVVSTSKQLRLESVRHWSGVRPIQASSSSARDHRISCLAVLSIPALVRDVEELLASKGVLVSCEAVRLV
jgi:hypothetical protein